MFRFENPEYFYLLYLIPVIVVGYWFIQKNQKKLLKKFADSKIHDVLFPQRSKVKPYIKFSILVLALIFLVFSLANPQVGAKIEEVKQVGIDVYILLDVSLSMKAEDIKPSRLDKAKYQINRLIQRLKGDRIGLIVFSGEAYVQFPLTTDYSAANLFLSAVDVSSVPQPGTAIGPAIDLAVKSFKGDEETRKAIIVITDGEDHEGELENTVDEAVEKGIQIYAIGLGSPAGVPIPVYNSNGRRTGYKKDNQENVVLTKLDESTLKEITKEGNGKYYRGSNSEDELDLIYRDLSQLEQTEYGATRVTDYEDRYYWFLIPALILLFIEFFISQKKSKLLISFENKIK